MKCEFKNGSQVTEWKKRKKAIRQCQQGWRLLQLFDIVPLVKTWHHTLLRTTLQNRNICRDPRGSSWLPHLADVVLISAGIAQSNGWALPKPIGQGTNWGLTKSSQVHSEGLTITPHSPPWLRSLCTSTRALPKSLGTKQRALSQELLKGPYRNPSTSGIHQEHQYPFDGRVLPSPHFNSLTKTTNTSWAGLSHLQEINLQSMIYWVISFCFLTWPGLFWKELGTCRLSPNLILHKLKSWGSSLRNALKSWCVWTYILEVVVTTTLELRDWNWINPLIRLPLKPNVLRLFGLLTIRLLVIRAQGVNQRGKFTNLLMPNSINPSQKDTCV